MPTLNPEIPEAVKAIPGDKGVQLAAFDVPEKLVVVEVPVKQGLLFDRIEVDNDES